MKNSSIRLMTLLKLLTGQFEPDEKRRVKTEVRANSEALARFRLLRDTAQATKTLELRSGLDELKDDEMLQRMAAFLDGTLNAEETIEFENDCWNSPDLLHDVIALFQPLPQSQPMPLNSSNRLDSLTQEDQLRQRLVDLFPGPTTVLPEPNGVESALTPTLPERSDDLLDGSIEDQPIVVVPRPSREVTQTSTHASRAIMMAIAVAVMLIVALSIVVFQWQSNQKPANFAVETPTGPANENVPDEAPLVVVPNETDDRNGSPDSLAEAQLVDSPDRDESQPNEAQPLRDMKAPPLPNNGSRDGLVDRSKPKTMPSPELIKDEGKDPSHTPDGATPNDVIPSLQWSWGRVEGLVAVRQTDSEIWFGALAENEQGILLSHDLKIDAEPNIGLDFKVLPFSWGQAKLEGKGNWTIAENTEFSITTTPVSQRSIAPSPHDIGVKINLVRGRIAIADADIDSVMSVNSASGKWQIRITEASSVVIVEQGSIARVLVQKGTASVNGIELTSRQQLVRSRGGRSEQSVNRLAVKWLKKPENKFPNKQFSEQWLASRDLFADLNQIDSVAPENQPLMRAAFATIDPSAHAVKYLANVMPDVRAEGIQWLLTYAHDERRLRMITNDMATELGTPGLRATLPRLVVAIKRKRLPARADAESLVTGLQHRNPSVQRLSHALLAHLFGPVEAYNSGSDATARNLQARKWLVAVNRIYHRVDNARQR